MVTRNLAIVSIIAILSLGFSKNSEAQSSCPAVPFNFSNGTTADAPQVNSNFNYLIGCANGTTMMSTPGYQKLASGIIIQWTYVNVPAAAINSGNSANFTWPITFPHGLFAVQVSQWNGGAWTFGSSQSNTTSGGTVAAWNLAGTPGTNIPYSVVGIGY